MTNNFEISAPVVIFVYKRPEHTKKVISVIKNINIKKIYVIADGWKNENENAVCIAAYHSGVRLIDNIIL